VGEDDNDFAILSLANHKRKFGIEIRYTGFSPGEREAFERGIDNEWFTLVDISPVAVARDRLLRVFRLTDSGLARLSELAKTRSKS
jgi:hypothetical protein